MWSCLEGVGAREAAAGRSRGWGAGRGGRWHGVGATREPGRGGQMERTVRKRREAEEEIWGDREGVGAREGPRRPKRYPRGNTLSAALGKVQP